MDADRVKPEVIARIEAREWTALRATVSRWPAPEIADLLLELRKPDRVLLFRALPRDRATETFSHLSVTEQDALLHDLSDAETRELLAGLSPDDRTALLAELPGQVTQRLLNLLEPEEMEKVRLLLGYPDGSAGRLMTPDYVAVHPSWTVSHALTHIRARGRDSETINRIYVVDDDWRLLDDIELRRLILAEPTSTIEEVMDHAFIAVPAFADRGEAVRLIRRYDQVAVPVIDSGGVLLGIVTVDDVLDVAEAEATEDFHRVGSVGPLRTSLRDASIPYLYSRRIGWLLALVFVNIFSAEGMAFFADTITATVALVFFLPLLIGSSGNAGSQATTMMIRAMAVGDVTAGDWLRLLAKEFAVATSIGLTMAVAVSFLGIYRGGLDVGLVVAASMIILVVLGSVIGMSLPFLLSRLRLDPATASAPLVTSLADISGVLVYFSIATWYLGG